MRAPPAKYNLALRRDQATLLRVGIFAQRPSAGALTFYTASETPALPGVQPWRL